MRCWGFELGYEAGWVAAFDNGLAKLAQAMDEAHLPENDLASARLSVVDAAGVPILELEGLDCGGAALPGPGPGLAIAARFPLRVRLEVGDTSKPEPLTAARLREVFLSNLSRKPPHLDGPISPDRIEELRAALGV